jgi:hypothetical protein
MVADISGQDCPICGTHGQTVTKDAFEATKSGRAQAAELKGFRVSRAGKVPRKKIEPVTRLRVGSTRQAWAAMREPLLETVADVALAARGLGANGRQGVGSTRRTGHPAGALAID